MGGAFQLQCQLGTQCYRPRLEQGMTEQGFLETLECDIEQVQQNAALPSFLFLLSSLVALSKTECLSPPSRASPERQR